MGRISDYGNIRSDLYKIAEYLSESKTGYDKNTEDFFELALQNKKSLLDKINFREKQLAGEIPRFDWMNPNNFNQIKKASEVIAFFGFFIALLFLFPTNLSGAVILESELKKNSIIGLTSLLIGLVSFLFLFKVRKHK